MIVEYIDRLGILQRARQANEGEITMVLPSRVDGGYQMFLTHGELMKIPADEVED